MDIVLYHIGVHNSAHDSAAVQHITIDCSTGEVLHCDMAIKLILSTIATNQSATNHCILVLLECNGSTHMATLQFSMAKIVTKVQWLMWHPYRFDFLLNVQKNLHL